MASSLGTLTLDLIARIGGFTGPLDKAAAAARKSSLDISGSIDEASAAMLDLGSAVEFVAGVITGISFGAIFTQFINNTIDAQNEQIQLAAVLKSTGNAAGYTQGQLNAIGESLVSTFSGGEITTAQTSLLAFTGIVGDQFPRALQAAADMATRTGVSVSAAAETIGRSLDVPSAGLSSLSKQGFRFTESQKELVDALESVGDVAAAQNVVLEALESTYGGAAAAAAGSLGGAIANLSNAFNDLLTGDSGLGAATEVIKSVTEALKDPGAKVALETAAKAAAALAVILSARLAASAITVSASFVAATVSTIQYQFALARMAGVSATAATGLIALGVAATAARVALGLLGGTVGVAILAASAVAYFALSSDDADDKASGLADSVDYLNKSFDGFTKNQAKAALQDINEQLLQAQLKALDAESAVSLYEGKIRNFPNDSRQREWNESLVTARGELDGARQGVEALVARINELNGIIAAPVEVTASKVYTDLITKMNEQLAVSDKITGAAQLRARIEGGFIKGLKAGEGELLIAKQEQIDAGEKAAAAAKKAVTDKAAADKAAVAAADAVTKKGEDAITDYKRQIELIDETTGARAKASEASKVAFDIESGKLKGVSAAQKERLTDLAKELDARKALVKANDESAKLAAFEANLRSSNKIVSDSFDLEMLGAGEGDRFKERLKQNLAIEQDYQKQREELYREYQKATLAGDSEAETRYKKETDLLSQALEERKALQEDYYKNQDEQQNNWLAGVSSAWKNYKDTATDYQQQAADATSSILGDATSSLSSSIQGLATGAITVGEAFQNLGATMAGSVLKAIADIAAQWVVTQALQLAGIGAVTTATVTAEGVKTAAKVGADAVGTASTLGALATTTAANVAAAGTTLASWLPAALVASVGSFGAAAIVGGAALVAAFALIKGFETGGYTGDGASDAVAGIVHKGEFVFTKAQTQAIGLGKLEAIAAGYETGGLVGAFPVAMPTREGVTSANAATKLSSNMASSQGDRRNSGPQVNIIEDASKAGQTRTRLDETGMQEVMDVWVSRLYNEDDIFQALQGKTGARAIGE